MKGLQPGSPAGREPEGSGGTSDRGGSEGMLTLEALRQMRERGIPIDNLELLVSSEGKWLAAKVYKVDHDFKKVCGRCCVLWLWWCALSALHCGCARTPRRPHMPPRALSARVC